jgi:hypothetical protein
VSEPGVEIVEVQDRGLIYLPAGAWVNVLRMRNRVGTILKAGFGRGVEAGGLYRFRS